MRKTVLAVAIALVATGAQAWDRTPRSVGASAGVSGGFIVESTREAGGRLGFIANGSQRGGAKVSSQASSSAGYHTSGGGWFSPPTHARAHANGQTSGHAGSYNTGGFSVLQDYGVAGSYGAYAEYGDFNAQDAN